MHLFLDRDGVLNRRIIGDYVRSLDQWEWLPDVLDTMVNLKPHFETVIVVTNQQGVGKGLFEEDRLLGIMEYMKDTVENLGGKLDEYYYCPHLSTDDCSCRKPRIGMGFQALREFPDIDFKDSIMVGDSGSDIEFGKKLGMKTVYVSETGDKSVEADFYVRSLKDFYVEIVCNNLLKPSTKSV
jgi:histidinol-phosphate phosphatase family protein